MPPISTRSAPVIRRRFMSRMVVLRSRGARRGCSARALPPKDAATIAPGRTGASGRTRRCPLRGNAKGSAPQLVGGVERRDLVALRERRVVEDGAEEIVEA